MKGKCVFVQAMKECSGRTGSVPLILTSAVMEDWPTSDPVRFTFGKSAGTDLMRGWVGRTVGLDGLENRKIPCPSWSSSPESFSP